VSCSFTTASASPPFTSTLTIAVSAGGVGGGTLPGYYAIAVTGTAGSQTRVTVFTLYVT
jgi:hypothetical protein